MRTRVIEVDHAFQPDTGYGTIYGGSPHEWPEAGLDVYKRYESMTDLQNPPPPCGFKPCEHTKLSGDWRTGRIIESHPYGGVATGYRADRSAQGHMVNTVTGHHLIPPYLESLYNSAESKLSHSDRWMLSSVWEKAKPKLEPNMDILVFLAEIKEVPELLKSILGKARYLLSDVSEIAGKLFKHVDGLKVLARHSDVGVGGMLKIVMDETSHAISQQWLEYNFALAPTVNDFIGGISALFEWEQKMADLIAGAEKPQKAHFSFAINEDISPHEICLADCKWFCIDRGHYPSCPWEGIRGKSFYDEPNAPGDAAVCTAPGGQETRIGLTVYYRYSLPAWVNDVSAKINGLAAALGCNPGLGTIWDLIPFSFVVDWVFPIGDILEKARIDALPVKTDVLDVCWTKRVTRSIVIHSSMGPCPFSRTPSAIYQGKLETFSRMVGEEPFTWIPAFKWPNWFQLSLGAALLKK